MMYRYGLGSGVGFAQTLTIDRRGRRRRRSSEEPTTKQIDRNNRKLFEQAYSGLGASRVAGATVVDVGCGDSELAVAFIEHFADSRPAKWIAIDCDPKALEKSTRNLKRLGIPFEVRQADLKHGIPLEDGEADIEFAIRIMNYFQGPGEAAAFLQEILRGLRSGGDLVIVDILSQHACDTSRKDGHSIPGFMDEKSDAWRMRCYQSLPFAHWAKLMFETRRRVIGIGHRGMDVDFLRTDYLAHIRNEPQDVPTG